MKKILRIELAHKIKNKEIFMELTNNNQKKLPCGCANCLFSDCVSIADGNDGVVCSVAPCEGFEGCPRRLGITN